MQIMPKQSISDGFGAYSWRESHVYAPTTRRTETKIKNLTAERNFRHFFFHEQLELLCGRKRSKKPTEDIYYIFQFTQILFQVIS